MTSPLRYLIVLFIATVFGILAVAQQARVIHLGRRVERLGGKARLLAENNRLTLCDIGVLSHPARIAEATERFNLELTDPVTLNQSSVSGEPDDYDQARQAARR